MRREKLELNDTEEILLYRDCDSKLYANFC